MFKIPESALPHPCSNPFSGSHTPETGSKLLSAFKGPLMSPLPPLPPPPPHLPPPSHTYPGSPQLLSHLPVPLLLLFPPPGTREHGASGRPAPVLLPQRLHLRPSLPLPSSPSAHGFFQHQSTCSSHCRSGSTFPEPSRWQVLCYSTFDYIPHGRLTPLTIPILQMKKPRPRRVGSSPKASQVKARHSEPRASHRNSSVVALCYECPNFRGAVCSLGFPQHLITPGPRVVGALTSIQVLRKE